MSSSQTYLFAQHISDLLDKGEKLDWLHSQKIAKEFDIKTDTEIMQACELAVVLSARKIANNGNTIHQQYEEMKDLYERQVTIRPLDTKSKVLQQYSTPCPLAFLLGTFVRQASPEYAEDYKKYFETEKYLEPSAGNGMLTIALPTDKTYVNELDEVRLENLKQQGFHRITNRDASQEGCFYDIEGYLFKGIITNPPFAKLSDDKKIKRNGWEINTLDYKMACIALDQMMDDGRAAIIVGGKMWNAYWKPVSETSQKKMLFGQWKSFLGYLYAQYNVKDVIYVDGESIYRKQGTQYPIAIILIDGRHKYDESNKPRYVFDPSVDYIIETYDQLSDRIFPYLNDEKKYQKPKETSKMMIFWWYKDGKLFKNDGWYKYDKELIKKKAEKCTKDIMIKCFIREDDYENNYHREHTITLTKPKKQQKQVNTDKQKQAKALMLKMKMSKSCLSYIPPQIFKNLGLGEVLLVGDTSRELLQNEYAELRSMGDALSKKNTMYRKAYEWTSELVPEHFSSAFTAALMIQKAGFPLPKIKAISTAIPERGVGGMYTVSPYFRKTTIQLSTSNYFRSYGGLEPAFEESYRQKWNSTPNCALHELCHHIAFLIDSEYNQMNRRMTEMHKNNARTKVSGYARQKYCEFCAEVISGILYGIKYPDYIIDYLPEGNYGTKKEQEAFKKLKEIGRQANKEPLGAFIPPEILQRLDGVNNCVTPLNLDKFAYTDEQKSLPMFRLFEKAKFLKTYYETNSIAHCAVDNWCKVMNKTFDFVLPIDMNKVQQAYALSLKMRMSKATYRL